VLRLVVDTSVLVGELLRPVGRQRLEDDRLELFVPEEMRDELQVELPRRVTAFASHRGLRAEDVDHLLDVSFRSVSRSVNVLFRPVYGSLADEAAWRSVRDPTDWPLVACALALDAGIWTNDQGLFGTGVPTWITPTVQGWLDHNPDR